MTEYRTTGPALSSPAASTGPAARRRRPYRQRARAEQQAATRHRIAAAAAELHGSIGPARTTVSAIAERAGVERLTVYRHFPDERRLFAACSAHHLQQHPPPDLSRPMAEPDPARRLESVLRALYGYYRETEAMLTALLRDAASVPMVSEYLRPYLALLAELTASLNAGFVPRRSRGEVRAAIGHALAFTSWHTLALEQGLTDRKAAVLMTRFVAGLAHGRDGRPSSPGPSAASDAVNRRRGP